MTGSDARRIVSDDTPYNDNPVVRTAEFGASEDATYLIVGTDHQTNHLTPTFDIDERILVIGVELLVDSIDEFSRRRP